MTREQECIKELYSLVDRVVEDAKKRDLSLLRIRGEASGCDMFQGLPPICRILSDITDRYDDVYVQHSKNEIRSRE